MTNPTRGAKFREDVLEEFELTSAERVILDEVVRTLDTIDSLPADAVAEQRAQRVVLSRLLGQLNLPTSNASAEPKPSMSGKSVRARAAAKARWSRQAAN